MELTETLYGKAGNLAEKVNIKALKNCFLKNYFAVRAGKLKCAVCDKSLKKEKKLFLNPL